MDNEETKRLRAVYEAALRVLRFNGVDYLRTAVCMEELNDAVERVKSLDSGLEDDAD